VQPRLTPEARFEILRRLASGERGSRLAREFGCTRQAISLLWQKHLANPKGFNKRLTREEIRELEKEVRAATSRRKAPALSTKEVHAMAEKKFRRKLFYLPIQKLWQSWAD
jgi:transposase-like protein